MTKVENKELTFEEMEAQLFYAYQQRKCKYCVFLNYKNEKKSTNVELYIQQKVNGFICGITREYINNISSYKENKKSFDEAIEILNGKEPDFSGGRL